MKARLLRLRVLLVCGVALYASACASTRGHLQPWLELRTDHFEILTPHGERQALELARSLELFHSVVEISTQVQVRPSPVPLRVYALDRGTYRELDAPRRVAGFFLDSPRASTIVIGDIDGWTDDVLRHEYVHFVVRNRGNAYPVWYDEGFAEFLSNVRLTRKGVEIGRPQEARIRSVARAGWLPVGELVQPRSVDPPRGRTSTRWLPSSTAARFPRRDRASSDPA